MDENRANESTADSAQKDISSAIQMGKNAAQTAKTIAKTASEAATGNVVGAATTLLKDPETLKKILLFILIPIMVFSLLVVCFLYALPSAIYETVTSYFAGIAEDWESATYGSDGDVVWAGVVASIKVAGEVVSDAAQGLWNSFVGLFKGSSDDDGTEELSTDGTELHVTQVEAATKETLNRKLDLASAKIDKRVEQLETSLRGASSSISTYFSNLYADTCDVWAGTTIDIQTQSLSKSDAVTLLSLYTVITETATKPMALSDFAKWLGYYNASSSKRTQLDIGNSGIVVEVIGWDGTFMPQYLVELEKYEIEVFGETQTDFSEYQCAVVDMLLIVDCVDFADIRPTYVTKTRTVDDTSQEADADGNYPQTEESYTEGSVVVNISIKARSAKSLSEMVGLWDGALPSPKDADEEGQN